MKMRLSGRGEGKPGATLSLYISGTSAGELTCWRSVLLPGLVSPHDLYSHLFFQSLPTYISTSDVMKIRLTLSTICLQFRVLKCEGCRRGGVCASRRLQRSLYPRRCTVLVLTVKCVKTGC